jgi:SAM-dependent methyltransferase
LTETLGPVLDATAVATFDEAVSRYLSFFGALVVDMLLPAQGAAVAFLGSRTGFPDTVVSDKMPDCAIWGIDPSRVAVEAARKRATAFPELRANYDVGASLPTSLSEQSFTHSLALHPTCSVGQRGRLVSELRRLLIPSGQALYALPLRGSFPELYDMLREFALRHELAEYGAAIDASAAARPNLESVTEEFEDAGLGDVDVNVELITLSFSSGREFLEHPAFGYVILPELLNSVADDKEMMTRAKTYLNEAVAKYWSDGTFDLTVNVGCVSGRRF